MLSVIISILIFALFIVFTVMLIPDWDIKIDNYFKNRKIKHQMGTLRQTKKLDRYKILKKGK
jgi:hypothetical protein